MKVGFRGKPADSENETIILTAETEAEQKILNKFYRCGAASVVRFFKLRSGNIEMMYTDPDSPMPDFW